MSTVAKELEHIQQKFVAMYQYVFFQCDYVNYKDFLKFLKLHT